MRWVVVLLVLGGAVGAQEPDGAIAPANRWTEPRGCASGSFRSDARPVVDEIVEAWTLKDHRLVSPPVHWDGTGYAVVQDAGDDYHVIAFSLADGEVLSERKLKDYVRGSGIFVWDDQALVQTEETQINGYRFQRGKLDLDWIFRGPSIHEKPYLPVVHDNEVYCFLGASDIARIRPGMRAPTWTVRFADRGELTGRPAVCGAHVFMVVVGDQFTADAPGEPNVDGRTIASLFLLAFRRTDGEMVANRRLGQVIRSTGDALETQLTVTAETVLVGSTWEFLTTGSASNYCLQVYTQGAMGITFADPGFWNSDVPPAHTSLGCLLRAGRRPARTWTFYRDRKLWTVTSEDLQPALFKDETAPTVLGEILYFGTWAMDAQTREILWRLPIAKALYPAVPADRMVLVVDEERVLHAYRGRETHR